MPKHTIELIGEERQPVIVIDDFVPNPAALRAKAEALTYQPMGRHYPGLRAEVAPEDVAQYLSPNGELIAQTFGFTRGIEVVSAGYSIVTTHPSQLTPIQRLPHYDAMLHRDVAQHGLPEPSYISGDTPIYQQIARFAARPNRALIYRGHTLHCADLPAGLDLSPDPKRARLTVNTFLLGLT